MAIKEVTVVITTASQAQKTWQNTGTPPKITMDGKPFPQPAAPTFSSGIQVVVIDPAMDITSPASIRSNKYQWLPNVSGSWMSSYQYMWDRTVSQVLTSGNTSQQIVFVATFGMDVDAAPTPEALALLLELGAGPQLQKWWTSVNPGSQSGQWVGRPGNYILVGQSQHGYGEGEEAYSEGAGTKSLTATLTNFAGE